MNPFSILRTARDPLPLALASGGVDLSDQLPDALLAVSAEGRVMRANPAAVTLFARSAAKLAGARLDSLLQGELPTDLATAAVLRFDARVERSRGDVRVVAVSTAPLREVVTPPDGVATDGSAPSGPATTSRIGTLLVLRDVTAERTAVEELTRSESRYRRLFEGASDAIMTFDSLGRFTTVNDAGEAISGFAREELIGRFFGPLLAIESLPRAIIEFRRALSGAAGQFEAAILRKDGERRYITVNYACPERSREVLCMIRDATEEKKLQQQLIQSEKMAAIGQLVSGVAHEVNNPLASISAFAQLLLADRSLTPDQRHSVDVISGESRRAARIVHNLLTFARQHKAEKVFADINKVLEDTLELRAYELNVRGIRIERDMDTTPPETMVDVYQLQQVLLNLVTNAEHAMASVERPQHRLTVRSRMLPNVVRIEVEDTGPGIPSDTLDVIFNPFYTTKPTGQGTGLGLSISLGIVSEHNGRIWAESAGHGSRFCIELPRIGNGRRSAPALPATMQPASTALRILVVDDEEPIRAALERYLASAGHQVVTVSSGSEAIWRAEGDEEFDTILLDMRMPDVSGKQIFERWTTEHPELVGRVIFLTGDIVSDDLQRFLGSTGRPYLPKPFEFEQVLRVLPTRRLG